MPALTPLVLLGSLANTACGDEEEAAVTPPPTAATPSPTRAEKAAEADSKTDESDAVYTYNAIGKRDPFRTYFAELEHEETEARKLSELQLFDLDQLRLVAVVVGTATPVAMVEDPTGKGHAVKVGTVIGKHWGQVKHIRRGEIIIQEEFRDFTGRRVTHLVPMKLPEEKEETAIR
ncbi:MAG: pilus assembly protein PilP [Deltaproteobacteria bacterium]|nr:pilus assembly protein PilP [Deltaproteobacteria bacterium]